MAREPYDVFLKEFLQHPAWGDVFEKINLLASDCAMQATVCTKDDHDYKKGIYYGVLEVASLLRGLIKNSKDKG